MAWLYVRIDDAWCDEPAVLALEPDDRLIWLRLLLYCAPSDSGSDSRVGRGGGCRHEPRAARPSSRGRPHRRPGCPRLAALLAEGSDGRRQDAQAPCEARAGGGVTDAIRLDERQLEQLAELGLVEASADGQMVMHDRRRYVPKDFTGAQRMARRRARRGAAEVAR